MRFEPLATSCTPLSTTASPLEEGFPVWGTKFDETEQQGMDIGHELARQFMEQSVASQAQAELPAEALQPQGKDTPQLINKDFKSTLETPVGEIDWDQPKTRLTKARQDFFPSGESAGD
jgi:hypothetical protein